MTIERGVGRRMLNLNLNLNTAKAEAEKKAGNRNRKKRIGRDCSESRDTLDDLRQRQQGSASSSAETEDLHLGSS